MQSYRGTYQHYKGNYYIVHSIGKHTETGEHFVIYSNVYDPSGEVWIRPFDMFFETVVHYDEEGHIIDIVPRFTKIAGEDY